MDKIVLRAYTDQFYTLDGKPFEGEYYVDESNKAYSNDVYRRVLIPTYMYKTEYYRSKAKSKGGFRSPHPYLPHPSIHDYSVGYIDRYFVQKRNNPIVTIIEIEESQYNGTTYSDNYNAINSNIYNEATLRWMILGDENYVENYNSRSVKEISRTFVGIDIYLSDLKQFYRPSLVF